MKDLKVLIIDEITMGEGDNVIRNKKHFPTVCSEELLNFLFFSF